MSQAGQPGLARTMGLPALVIYGVGDMLGAGIYGLIGQAAGLMGYMVWLAFAGSMVAAALTGLSYACLGSRYPRAAGAAYVTHRAFRLAPLTYVLGLCVTASGLTSMATGSRVIAGYLQKLGLELPVEWMALGFLVLLTGVVLRGMRESTWMNAVCTAVEFSGLVLVIAVGLPYWGSVDYLTPPPGVGSGADLLRLTLQGSVLTFFSFIGFEDMLNVSEEVKDPERTIPRALVIALLVATAIYMAVAITAVSVLPPEVLAKSPAALVDVVTTAAPWVPRGLFTGIGIFAVANTALLNYIMGSRLLYGMSRQGLLPAALGTVHPTRQVPQRAALTLLAVVAGLVMIGDISALAAATSLLLLSAFVVVNTALLVLKGRRDEPIGQFEIPAAVPLLGAVVCLCLIAARLLDPKANPDAPMIAGGIIGISALLYLVMRPKNVVLDG